MTLSRRHLKIFHRYKGKEVNLLKLGTTRQKALFQNGEFEQLLELSYTQHLIDKGYVTDSRMQDFDQELKRVFSTKRNRRFLKYISGKLFQEKQKEDWSVQSFLDMIGQIFNSTPD